MRPERIDRMIRAYGTDVAKWPEAGDLSDYAQHSPGLLRAAASVDAALQALRREPPARGMLEDEALAEAAIARAAKRRWDNWPLRAAAASVLFAAVLGAATGSFTEMNRVESLLFSTKQGAWGAPIRPLAGRVE
ncbi:MAG: hypothetical protein LW713_13435 [Acetobacteraceae bacterium]|nr:hypothetical protein [Roseomonas sp.]MCE2761999.1 hypothetical protein [Acetobacteraceae bacterium]